MPASLLYDRSNVKTWTIYCHIHIESRRRYIGLTSNTMMQRWKKHIYSSKSSKGGRWHFANAIRKYGKDAFSHEILEICYDLDQANLAEDYWIEKLDTRNPKKGFNLAKGGGSQPRPIRKNPWNNPEYRAKCEIAARAKWDSPEFRIKMMAREFDISGFQKPEVIEQIRQIHQSPEFKSKMSNITMGKIRSSEICAAMSNRMKGHKKTPEVKAKISASLKGRTLSEEVRRRISESSKGRVIGLETRAKIAAANTGRRHTEESKAKMSLIHKERAYHRKVV